MSSIKLITEIERTPRVMQIEGMFDIDAASRSVTEIPLNLPDLTERDWNVGLIVGPSGAGKSTVARELFNKQMVAQESLQWSRDRSLIDDFPKDLKIQDITTLLSSVGFSSPPSWLRPFGALSNGEQFRVSMARLLAEQPDLAVVDEFTSVVDRTVAQIGSHAIAKTVRKRGQKLVAVTCHYDVQDWLQPDWIYQPATGEFSWGSVQPRPRVNLKFVRTTHEAWKHFSRHHYLNHTVSKGAKFILGLIDDRPAVLIATLYQPHPRTNNLHRVSRIVVLPDFQGLGLGNIALDLVGGAFVANGNRLNIVTSHPALIRSLNKGGTWKMNRKPSRVNKPASTSKIDGNRELSNGRLTTTFSYVGPAIPTLANLLKA
jgi:ABC-type lipoprotein export system ATPase subunit